MVTSVYKIMMVAIIGRMRSGKSLLMSILANTFYQMSKNQYQLWANYSLKNSIEVTSTKQLWKMKNGIFCFDEIWLTMDSHFWKDVSFLTYWIMQTAKRGVVVFYTAQNRHQIEKRTRSATDLFILSNSIVINGKKCHKYTFLIPDLMDEDKFTVGRSYILYEPQNYYNLFDSFKLIWPIKHEKITIDEMRKLSN